MGMLLESANPRHEHEWEVWKTQKLPADRILIPGVLATTSNYVEAPELVAQRLLRFAELVGRERVIAGTDCGFGTFAGFGPDYPDIAWLKLQSLTQGAALASAPGGAHRSDGLRWNGPQSRHHPTDHYRSRYRGAVSVPAGGFTRNRSISWIVTSTLFRRFRYRSEWAWIYRAATVRER